MIKVILIGLCILLLIGCDTRIPEAIIIERNITRLCEVNCSDGFYWEGNCKELKVMEDTDCIVSVTETDIGTIKQVYS